MFSRTSCGASLSLGKVSKCCASSQRKYTKQIANSLVVRSPLDELKSRGLVAKLSDSSQVNSAFIHKSTVYLGVDPTAGSIHAGNLVPLMALIHFHISGHQVISLTGGATGAVGDPGGRNTERPLLSIERVNENARKISSQLQRIFSNGLKYAEKRNLASATINPPKFLNNLEWLGGMGLLDFLRLAGKRATVSVMMAKDSVKSRLRSEHGISFTEFSYQLLQAYDYYVLHRDYGCTLQIGGSDQWGNITAGLELIRRIRGESLNGGPSDALQGRGSAYGMTTPLLLTASGEKFGKSSGNAVWLDPELTSVFDFYQFFLRVGDADVAKYLKIFTLLPLSEIEQVISEHEATPEKRIAQGILASEVTELIHGESAVTQAKVATSILFPGSSESSSSEANQARPENLIAALGPDRRLVLRSLNEFCQDPVTKLAAILGLTNSRGEARKLLASGGLYLNDQRLSEDITLSSGDFVIGQRVATLRAGKENKLVLAIKDEEA
ncbi:uncharacterized protein EI90DRAFT_2929729 [Cantharellus anzutake]|uniref:uncharacterized protein n=1 Tax=Cantharellus anzutake TaxID=1750568 RepID=UPI001907EE98|nr:uncharacterized protein EI90DRAFT_2929729 [Cantharellus anzutake]KAF8326670.1 hypothetical protein EI90DRAFT_2929729 [Cantharellus anzutake]